MFGACDVLGTDRGLPPGQVSMDELVPGGITIQLSPASVTPLAAEVSFSTRVAAEARVEVLGPEPVTHTVPALARTHAVPVLGLYPGTENLVALEVRTAGGTFAVDTLRVSTEPLPAFLPDITIDVAERARMEPGWTLSSLSVANGGDFASYPIIFDSNGDIRWYADLSELGGLVYMVERLENGNLVFGVGEAVREWDMLGREVRRWTMPGYIFHHDVIEKPDGNLLVAVNKGGLETIEDHVVEVDRQTGAIVREWDLRTVLDVSRRTFPSATDNDWFHMNAIWYDESDGGLILSGRNQSAVVKVSEDNELVWILGGHRGWGPAGVAGDGHDTSGFLLTAIDEIGTPFPEAVQMGDEDAADFSWPWGQHAPLILPNGNIFLFDNGVERNFTLGGPMVSRGVEYEIDQEAMTVREVWSYGAERGAGYSSSIISDVDYLLETGNRLVMPGIVFGAEPRAWVTEIGHPDGQVVFEARIDFKNLGGNGELQWGEFDMVYRSERLSLYPGE